MNPETAHPPPEPATAALIQQLQEHLGLCQEIFGLALGDNEALQGASGSLSLESHQQRKTLLARLEQSVAALRQQRQAWQQLDLRPRTGYGELMLLRSNQDLIMKIILLSRDNEQRLLRRGGRTVEAAAPVHPPHFVTDLYRRHLSG